MKYSHTLYEILESYTRGNADYSLVCRWLYNRDCTIFITHSKCFSPSSWLISNSEGGQHHTFIWIHLIVTGNAFGSTVTLEHNRQQKAILHGINTLTLSLSEDGLHLSAIFNWFIPTTKGVSHEASEILNSRCNGISETFRCSYFSNRTFLHTWFKALQKTYMGMFSTPVPEKIHSCMLHFPGEKNDREYKVCMQ